jgi:outer membrane biosynthesis protein TonB
MTGIAVVASARDANFAEQVRAGLQGAGLDAAIVSSLPKAADTRVVLLWSAALEAAHAIDAQALIGLWSEDRLIIVRRDATPIPLGLRDLPSFGAAAGVREIVAAARREKQTAGTKPRSRVGILYAVIAAIAIAGGGTWYYFSKASLEKQAVLTAMPEEAAGRAEAEAIKQAEAVKAREAAATEARSKAQGAADSARQAAVAKAPEAKKSEVAVAAPKAEAPPAVASKAEVPRPAPAPAAKSAEVPVAKSRSEREREEEDRLARQAVAKGEVAVAAASPTLSPAAGAPAPEAAELFQRAKDMEASDPHGAVKIYRSLARGGNAAAARRLGEIYEKGIPGIPRDYAESLQWYGVVQKLNEIVIAGTPAEPAPARSEAMRSAQAPVPAKPLAREPMESAPRPAKPVPTEPVKPVAPEPPKPVAPEPVKPVAPELPKPAAPEPFKAAPLPHAEKEAVPSYGLTILVALLALALILWWRRSRQRAPAAQPQPPAARPAPRAQADGALLFVSYSHKDRGRVEPIVSVIEEMGRRVWMDREDITGQAGWAGQIVRAIRECRAVVLMASPNSYSSDQVVRELYLAMNHKKTIVPIEIEPAEMPDELQYILAPFHHHRLSGGEPRAVIGRALAAV